MNLRLLIVIPAFLLTVSFLSGCGDAEVSPEEVVEDSYAAISDADWIEVCDSLTTSYKTEVADIVEDLADDPGLAADVAKNLPDLPDVVSCETVLGFVGDLIPDEFLDFADANITEVITDGDTATVTVEGGIDIADGDTVILEKTEDGWKIDKIGE